MQIPRANVQKKGTCCIASSPLISVPFGLIVIPNDIIFFYKMMQQLTCLRKRFSASAAYVFSLLHHDFQHLAYAIGVYYMDRRSCLKVQTDLQTLH